MINLATNGKRSVTTAIFLTFPICFLFPIAFAQDFWQPTGILAGGQIVSLNIDQEGILYAGAYNEGILTSSDGGLEWNLRLEGDLHEGFAEHPSGDVYVSGHQGLARSTDHGATWEWLPVYPGISFHGIAFNSFGHFLVGEESDWNIGHMLRSTDDGLTWERIYLDGSSDYPLDFVVKPNDEMFAAAGSVYKSTDAGATWVSSGAGLEDVSVSNLAVDSEGNLYAGTYFDGVFVSTDDGDSWVQANLDSAMAADIEITEDDRIFVGSSGVQTSTDHGLTWTQINDGLGNEVILSLAYAGDGTIVCGSWGSAFYRSTDYGEHWIQNTAGLAIMSARWVGSSSNGVVYVGTDLGGGVFASSDNGNSWVQSGLEGSYISPRSFSVRADGNVFVGLGGYGVYRTTDGGGTWAFAGLDGLTGVYLPLEVNIRGDFFAGWNPNGNGIHRSTDDGNTWTLLGEQDGINNVSCIAIGPDEDIYVGTFDTEIFRSTDNGLTWARRDSGITAPWIWSLGVNVNGDVFAAGSLGTIYKSTDRGATWTQSDSGFPYATAHDFLFTPSGNIYVAASGSGVYRSTDNGVSWHETSSGLTGASVQSLTLDDGGHVYAGTLASGVFRSTERVTSVKVKPEIPISFSLHQNYPNPFNPTTTFEFSIPHSLFANLSVYNLLGERVATLVDEQLPAGAHRMKWDASDQPSGVYFYRLTAGSFVQTRKLMLLR